MFREAIEMTRSRYDDWQFYPYRSVLGEAAGLDSCLCMCDSKSVCSYLAGFHLRRANFCLECDKKGVLQNIFSW